MIKGSHLTEEHKNKIVATRRINNSYNHTDEYKLKMSKMFTGRKVSDKTKQKISLSRTGIHLSDKTKLKLSLVNKGKKLLPETIKKIKETRMKNGGYYFSEDHRAKISKAQKGVSKSRESIQKMKNTKLINGTNYHSKESYIKRFETMKLNGGFIKSEETKNKISQTLTGHYVSEETKRKISLSNLANIESKSGSNHYNWRGGLSNQEYPFEFNHSLKEVIRSRDNYQCQICGYIQNEHRLQVHHVDYNKNNLKLNNLISLCLKCHAKTNHNREYYTEYFQGLLKYIPSKELVH
jgi:hypothetical protein